MRFFETILFGAALVAAVTIDQYPSSVVAGQTYTITYSPADDTPTTLLLRQGPSTDLTTIATLTTSATGGSFQWTPSTDLVNEDGYALQIFQGDETNYSGQFPVSGGSDEAMTSAVSSVMTSAVSSAMYSASTPSAMSSIASAASSMSASAASSASAAMSSAMSSIMSRASTAAASATISPSAGLNSTVTSATLSKTASASATGSKIPEVSTAAGNSLAQPMAAILGAAAAFAYLA